ncbi:hypothetical protein C479_03775 [Halovivax asiaticus JCM 14624]|uniref:DUF7344 domain-containing protein n=1 Tax=Halovivax asiaticus JCM 14624 TaxID=1227490 RepID=M0BSQ8_9EURY|nr:hypothetical protein [Halovivax asiaticus]ELZ12724.1 hypothetical protein C479_03775 [Halovivax asiaticus JCM 14624]
MNDKAFDALENEDRRNLLLALLEHNPQTVPTRSPVSEQVTSAAPDQQFQTAMYHKHLPKLDAYGFIRWDTETDEVVKGPEFEDIRPLLEAIVDKER